MKYFALAVAVLIALVLQAKMTILSFAPNFTVLLAYYAGMMLGETRGMIAGLMIGSIEDSLSSAVIGPNMLGKGLVGYFSSFFLSGGVFVWTPLLGILAVALLTMIDNIAVYVSLSIFDTMPTNPSTALLISAMQSILNAAAGMFIRPPHAD